MGKGVKCCMSKMYSFNINNLLNFVCFDALHSIQQFFSHVGTSFAIPALYQVLSSGLSVLFKDITQ